jgi:UDP-glucose 4-epimerase
VYCSPLVGVLDELTYPSNVHPYATSHLAGESVLLQLTIRHQLQVVVMRLSNAVGAPVTPETNCWTLLFNDLCRQVINCERITLRSDPSVQRDFIAMHDLVRAIEWFTSPPNHQAKGIFNVGSGFSMTLLEVAQMVSLKAERILGFKADIFMPEAKYGQSANLIYKNDKLLSTGFAFDKPFESEIEATLNLCKRIKGEGLQC